MPNTGFIKAVKLMNTRRLLARRQTRKQFNTEFTGVPVSLN